MAGVSIRVTHQTTELGDAFRRLRAFSADLSPAMRRIAGHMLFSTQRRFEAQRGPDGIAWRALAPSTIARNPRRAPPAPILRDSARLYASLVSESDATSAEAGTNVTYAAIHQFGGDIKRPAGRRTAHFRIAPQGAGRGKDGRRFGSRLRFARANSRASSLHERSFDVPEFSIRMPARPFLGFDAADEAEILAILGEETARAAGDAARSAP